MATLWISSVSSTVLPTPAPPKGATKDGFYDFTLHAPLTAITCVRLAKVIKSCKNKGTRKLRLRLPDGTVLEGWSPKDCYVNDSQIHYLAQDAGI